MLGLGVGFTSPAVLWGGGGGAAGAVGGAALLEGEADGFAADFTYATDAKRVAVKASGVVTEYAVDAFFTNAGTSPKQVYDAAGTLVWSPHNMFLNSGVPVTQSVAGLVIGQNYTVSVVGSGSLAGTVGASGTASAGVPATFTATGTSGTFTKTGTLTSMQLNRGSVATAYLVTTGAARFGLAPDYDPVTHAAKGLLCEPAGTNLLLWSSKFDDAANWGLVAATVTANATTAPNGQTEADKVVETAVNSTHQILQAVSATTGRLSCYCKAAERTRIVLYDVAAVKGDGFNLSTGTIYVAVGMPTTGGATIQNVGNGWYRCSIPTTAATSCNVVLDKDETGLSYLGDGTSGIYLWGAQLETGTVATSPIPTFAASATRAVDNYTVTPAAIGHSATAGSWWVENQQLTAGTSLRVIGYTTTASTPMYFIGTTPLFGIYDGGGLDKTITGTFVGTIHKVASAWQSGDRAITANGLAAATDTGPTTVLLSPGSAIAFGSSPPSGGTPMNGYLRKLYYLPRRMPNAELVTETTP